MDVITIKLLARYNSETNLKMNEKISALDEKSWNARFSGYYPSIRAVCNHLYIADFNWLKRLSGLRIYEFGNHDVFKESLSLASEAFTTTNEYIKKRNVLDRLFLVMAQEVTDEDFERPLRYKNFKGEDQEKNFGNLLLHVFNHQTHHRGMISLYLEMIGVQNDFSNLISLF